MINTDSRTLSFPFRRVRARDTRGRGARPLGVLVEGAPRVLVLPEPAVRSAPCSASRRPAAGGSGCSADGGAGRVGSAFQDSAQSGQVG